MMRSLLRKRSKTKNIKQQQQILITSKNTSKIVHFLKKNQINQVKKASDKTQTKQKYLHFTSRDMGPVHSKSQLQLNKKTAKLLNSHIFLKTINLKVKRTIRYQLKFFKRSIISVAYVGGH